MASVTGIGEVGTTTEGSGDVGYVFGIDGSADLGGFTSLPGDVNYVFGIDGSPELPGATDGTGSVQYIFGVDGTGESASIIEGSGNLQYIFGIDGAAEIVSPTDGTGNVQYIFGTDGLAETASSIEGSGDVRTVYSVDGVPDPSPFTDGSGNVQYIFGIDGVGETAASSNYRGVIVHNDLTIDGFGEVAPGTILGSGDVKEVFNVVGDSEFSGPVVTEGSGRVSLVFSISGVADPVSVTEGSGEIDTVVGLLGLGEVATTTLGTGFVKHNQSLTGKGEIGKFGFVADPNLPSIKVFLNIPIPGDVRVVYSVDGSGATPSTTDGAGVVGFGLFLAHGEVATTIDGVGAVELIPNLSAIATLASLEQINEALSRQLQLSVSVTFDATAYDQRADQLTLFAMKDIKDNWANYTDLKNGADIDWGVEDGTILTMTQAEFGTFYDDTMAAWRDRADRLIEKARDWSNSGVALATILDDANWA